MAAPRSALHRSAMARSHRFGRQAERLVAAHLASRGWRILDRNWRFRHKEVDLVAERDGTIVFVEVKARGPCAWADPLSAITAAKRRDLELAARAWVATRGRRGQAYRFDAAVVTRDGARTTVEIFEDAWRP
jgi:putative endonuclease